MTGRAVAAGAPWAPALSAALGLVAELSRRLEPAGTGARIACHRDFNPDNVLPAADGGLIVLDWENCGLLEPRQEVGYAVFCWCAGQGAFSTPSARAFLAGYTAASGTGPDLGAGLFSAAIATHVNVLKVMAEQALADAEHRSHAEGFIADLLGHYLADLLQLTSQPFAERILP